MYVVQAIKTFGFTQQNVTLIFIHLWWPTHSKLALNYSPVSFLVDDLRILVQIQLPIRHLCLYIYGFCFKNVTDKKRRENTNMIQRPKTSWRFMQNKKVQMETLVLEDTIDFRDRQKSYRHKSLEWSKEESWGMVSPVTELYPDHLFMWKGLQKSALWNTPVLCHSQCELTIPKQHRAESGAGVWWSLFVPQSTFKCVLNSTPEI